MRVVDGRMAAPLTVSKYFFVGVTVLAIIMIMVLYQSFGRNGMHILHEALSDISLSGKIDDAHHQNYEGAFNAWQQDQEDYGDLHEGEQKLGHSHKDEVHFVLHENGLGAPEFLGRNHRKAVFVEFDGRTYLNAPANSVGGTFNIENYKDINIAIGLAITTREQADVQKETLAKELPFFSVTIFNFFIAFLKNDFS